MTDKERNPKVYFITFGKVDRSPCPFRLIDYMALDSDERKIYYLYGEQLITPFLKAFQGSRNTTLFCFSEIDIDDKNCYVTSETTPEYEITLREYVHELTSANPETSKNLLQIEVRKKSAIPVKYFMIPSQGSEIHSVTQPDA